MTKKTRVLIVDDSKAMCRFLGEVLSSDPSLEVVGFALDPFEAREKIKELRPDILTLDVEMPRMDGITFLKNLMRLRPMPVVMLSSLTDKGAEVTLDALRIGAVDFLCKRPMGTPEERKAHAIEIIEIVKSAAQSDVGRPAAKVQRPRAHPDYSKWTAKLRSKKRVSRELSRVIAIGSSTGGPEALRIVLEGLQRSDAAVVISQHMPGHFMAPFGGRLDTYSSYDFSIPSHGEVLRPGCGYLAPGDRHLAFKKKDGDLVAQISDAPKCSGHRPSVDVMFESLAEVAGNTSIAIQLTGMGRDGAQGMKTLHENGCLTFAQDEATSVVWGMPGSAVELGGVDGILPLEQIAPIVSQLSSSKAAAA